MNRKPGTQSTKNSKSSKKTSAAAAQLAQALQLALQCHQSGKLDQAVQRYRAILAVERNHADALHYLGVAQHQLGHSAEAVSLIRQALALVPDYADAQNNLGNVLRESGHLAEAESAYRAVLALRPGMLTAQNNLGVVLAAQKRFDEAIALYRQCIEQKTGYAEAWHNLGNALQKTQQIDEALSAYRHAIKLAPYSTAAYQELGQALATLNRLDEALEVYREWQKLEPDNPLAAHVVAAMAGNNDVGRASDAYVQKTFDSFADSFEDVLTKLDYRAPTLCGELVARLLGTANAGFEVLDAGCGTGLCAPWLKPYARKLIGVDLSGGMLAKAAQRASYDQLHEAELTAFLQQHNAAWDLIVSADTLCYFGLLDEVLSAAATALRAQGLLVLTVEATQDATKAPQFMLHPHGRFSHTEAYVRASLLAAGLQVLEMNPVTLRMEAELPVAGLLVAAKRP
jgi:predicted TPR repeat methyltransferase